MLNRHYIWVISTGGSYHIIITEGCELKYQWFTLAWETTLENLDNHLVDPKIYHLPPNIIEDQNTLSFIQAN